MPVFYLIEKRNDISLLHDEKIKAADYVKAWYQARTMFPDMEVDVIDASVLDAIRKDKNLLLYMLSNTIWLNEDIPEAIQKWREAFRDAFLKP